MIDLRKIFTLKRFISGIYNVLNFFYENVNISDYSKVYLTNVFPWDYSSFVTFTFERQLKFITQNLTQLEI